MQRKTRTMTVMTCLLAGLATAATAAPALASSDALALPASSATITPDRGTSAVASWDRGYSSSCPANEWAGARSGNEWAARAQSPSSIAC